VAPLLAMAATVGAGCYTGLDTPNSATIGVSSAGGVGTDSAGGTDSGGTDSSGDSGNTGNTGDSGGPNAGALPWTPMHRLNRLEYNNTVRDLLGTTLRPADAFGPDPEANGFDNMAAQLTISSSLIDAYDQAARAAIAEALDPRPAFSVTFSGDTVAVNGGYPVGDLYALSGQVLTVNVEVPEALDAEVVLTGGGAIGGNAPAPEARFQVDGVPLPTFAVQGSAAIPASQVQPIALTAGTHTIQVVPTNHVNNAVANTFNNVFVLSLEVRSVEQAPGPGRSLVYVCEPAQDDDAACYAEVIRTFAARAWRRPLGADEEATLIALWNKLQAEGEGAETALRLVLRAVMLSPRFFYRSRTTGDADGDDWLDDYVLASRLSYFLWSSMPDQRLFDMAAEGRLATDEGLSEAVTFMLEDPRAGALLDGFAEQWLALRLLAIFNPDPAKFPGFNESVRAAMTEESRSFFADFLDNGDPVSSLILPDFTYRNDVLAAHYGDGAVDSAEMIRVPVEGEGRRGLLALGGWLTATSHADHSSPIRRGRWISERLTCTPVPPPPPGLVFEPPNLSDSDSVREALELHSQDPGCANCHALLDIVGIGLEEYNAVAQPVADPDVDNFGELPDGRTFRGAAGLADLFDDSEAFVDCFTRNLFTYALGRLPAGSDVKTLQTIALEATTAGATLPELIDAIVHTPSFRSPTPLDPGE